MKRQPQRATQFPPLPRPPVVLSDFHLNFRTNRCKKCGKQLRLCRCEKPEPYEMEDHGYQGPQRLDPSHPDYPKMSA